MCIRSIVALMIAAVAAPAHGQAPVAFERRMVAILDAGGTLDAVQARLDRMEQGGPLTTEQRIAVDAARTLVRRQVKGRGSPFVEAQAFAARHPRSPASSILLAEAALADNEPQRSADMLVAAATNGGPQLALISPALVSKLTGKLDDLSDKRRSVDLARALLSAGWSRGSPGLQSYLAMAVIRDDLSSSRVESARQLLPAVTNPAAFHAILIDNRLAALRTEVVRIAGPRLEKQWRLYLDELRAQWVGRGNARSAIDYASALRQADRHEALVDTFLSRFMRGYNCPTDALARSLAADLIDSLARLGRWSKAEDLMRRAGGVEIPVYAALLLERGEFGRAATHFDRAIRASGPALDREEQAALAWMSAARDCALFRNRGLKGRSGYDPSLLELQARIWVELCLDRPDRARDVLLAALANEDQRYDALRWMQPFADPPVVSAFRQDMSDKARALKRDPQLIAAVASHGEILDWSLAAAAPSEALLTGGAAAPPWRCGEQAELSGITELESLRPRSVEP